MKGIVRVRSSRWLAVHRAGSQVELSETTDAAGPERIVAIGPAERFRRDEIDRRWRQVLLQP